MKRSIATLTGALVLAAVLGAGSSALADSRGHGGGGRGGGHGDSRGGERGGPGGDRRGPGPGQPWGPRGGPPPGSAWDEQRHDGYWIGDRWHYGPPPGPIYTAPGFRPGYAPWRRGAFLPPYYQDDVVDQYWNYHLRRPPYGYHWVRVGDSFLLVSVGSGLIFDVIEGP